jgi:hypothetical protein
MYWYMEVCDNTPGKEEREGKFDIVLFILGRRTSDLSVFCKLHVTVAFVSG